MEGTAEEEDYSLGIDLEMMRILDFVPSWFETVQTKCQHFVDMQWGLQEYRLDEPETAAVARK